MSDQGGGNRGGGGNTGLALIVGALLVIVVVIAFFLFSGRGAPEAPAVPEQIDVNVDTPAPSGGG